MDTSLKQKIDEWSYIYEVPVESGLVEETIRVATQAEANTPFSVRTARLRNVKETVRGEVELFKRQPVHYEKTDSGLYIDPQHREDVKVSAFIPPQDVFERVAMGIAQIYDWCYNIQCPTFRIPENEYRSQHF